MPFFIVTTISTGLMPSGSSSSSFWNVFSSPKSLHLPCTAHVMPSLLLLLCLSLLFLHRSVLRPLLLLWNLPMNPSFDGQLNWIHFQIFSLTYVSFLILTLSLMALNPSSGYSISPEVTRYGTAKVAEFVSCPTWTFKRVYRKNGICVLLPHYALKLSPFSNVFQ